MRLAYISGFGPDHVVLDSDPEAKSVSEYAAANRLSLMADKQSYSAPPDSSHTSTPERPTYQASRPAYASAPDPAPATPLSISKIPERHAITALPGMGTFPATSDKSGGAIGDC